MSVGDADLSVTPKRALAGVLGVAAAFGFFYFVVPRLAGLEHTLDRIRQGNLWWIAAGVVLEAMSMAAYIALQRDLFGGDGSRIGWRASYRITLAGGAVTKLFAAAGAGGIALTVWVLRASGLSREAVGLRMVMYEIVNYAVFVVALVITGLGLWAGIFPGRSPTGLTVVPALLGIAVIALVIAMLYVAAPTERWLSKHAETAGQRTAPWWRRATQVPSAIGGGLRATLERARARDSWLLCAIPAWGFDIATLWAAFHAFGDAPPAAVLVMAYLLGTLGNAIPLPAGIGGVEGGMIGAFLGFGVNGSLAVIAVLTYRTITYWLPIVPGTVAYVRLRHMVASWRAEDDADPQPDRG